MHVNRKHGYGKGAVGFLIGYGLLPFWASSSLVFIGGIYNNSSEWWNVAPWLIIISIPICGATLLIAGITLKVHASADGDPSGKKLVAVKWFLMLNVLLVGLLYVWRRY